MDLRHRPAYHFAPVKNWLNDPNGLIHWRGRYHMFYQYGPFTPLGGAKHWGHAVSDDLAHWQHRPIALSPVPGGPDKDGVWSGCAINDDGQPMLLYTGVFPQVQCLAVGDETLDHWTRYDGNPVIAAPPEGLSVTGFRDPCVWREADGWYMALGSGFEGRHGAVLIYRSTDLLEWQYLHPLCVGETDETGRIWECPNFFELDGRHVLILSPIPMRRAIYQTGVYTDYRFSAARWGEADAGGCLYAPQYMIDAQGRRLLIGWLWEERTQEAQVSAGWAGVMSLPRVLSLDAQGRLCSVPVPEVDALREAELCHLSVSLDDETKALTQAGGNQLEIKARFKLNGANRVGVEVLRSLDGKEATRVAYDVVEGRLFCDRTRSSTNPETIRDVRGDTLSLGGDGVLDLRVYVDRSVVECFANGRVALTSRAYPERGDSLGLAVFAEGGAADLDLRVWQMGPCFA